MNREDGSLVYESPNPHSSDLYQDPETLAFYLVMWAEDLTILEDTCTDISRAEAVDYMRVIFEQGISEYEHTCVVDYLPELVDYPYNLPEVEDMPGMTSILYEATEIYNLIKLCAENEPELLAKIGKQPDARSGYEQFCAELLISLTKLHKKKDGLLAWFQICPRVSREYAKNRRRT